MFLETITIYENDFLIPIKDIKWIIYRINERGSYEIEIKVDEKTSAVECFDKNKEKADFRYEMIKYLLGVPREDDVAKRSYIEWKINQRKKN